MNLPYAALTLDPRTNRARPYSPYEIIGKVPNPNNPGELLDFRVSGASNPDGYFLESVPIGGVGTVRLYGAPGFSDVTYPKTFTDQHGVTDTLLLVPNNDPVPGPQPLELHLEVRGRDFVDKNGQPTCLPCVDQFQALRLMIDGEMGRLDDLAGEALGFGFNWWRVMLMGDISKNTLFSLYPSEARYRDCLYELPRWANRKGIGILGEAHADNQVVKANQSEQWRLVTDAFRGTTSIASGGNEHGSGNDHGKNGFDPQALENPGSGIVWSRGSAVADEVTPQHGATCSSFHQRTDYPKTLYDATASVLFMEEQGYTVCMMDEPTRFNLDGTTKTEHLPNDVPPTRFAWQLAKVYSAMWDLACFHNQAGQRGILMPPPLRAIAAEWARGMQS